MYNLLHKSSYLVLVIVFFLAFSLNVYSEDINYYTQIQDFNETSISYKVLDNYFLNILFDSPESFIFNIELYYYLDYPNVFKGNVTDISCLFVYSVNGTLRRDYQEGYFYYDHVYCNSEYFSDDVLKLYYFSINFSVLSNYTSDVFLSSLLELKNYYSYLIYSTTLTWYSYVPSLTLHKPWAEIGEWNESLGFVSYGDLWGGYDEEEDAWDGFGERSHPYVYVGDVVEVGLKVNNTGYGRAVNVSAYVLNASEGIEVLENGSVFVKMLNSSYDPNGSEEEEVYAVVRFNNTGMQTLAFYARNHDDVFNTTYTMEFEVLNPYVLQQQTALLKQTKPTNLSFTIYDNASDLTAVYANITYYDVVQNKYVNTIIPLRYYLDGYDDDLLETNVSVEVTALSPLPHNITFYFDIGKNVSFQGIYEVEPSSLEASLSPYRYLIMYNQTFNLTFNITAREGDVAYLNLTLLTYNATILNITSPYQNISLNLAEGESYLANWTLKTSLYTGVVSLKLVAYYYNATFEKIFVFEVVPVITQMTSNPYYFGNPGHVQAYVMGNFSPLLNALLEYECCSYASLTFYKQDTSSNCYSKSFTSQQLDVSKTYNGAYISYDQGYVSETPESAIDSSLTTYWTAESSTTTKAMINISFNATYFIGELKLLLKSYGDANLSILYLAPTNEWLPLKDIRGNNLIIPTPSAKSYINVSLSPVEAKALSLILETSDVLTFLYDVSVLTLSRVQAEPCYIYNLTLLTNTSGIVDTNITFIFNETTYSTSLTYNVSYGNVSLKEVTPNVLIYSTKPQTLTLKLEAYNGDLSNINITFASLNTAIFNVTPSYYLVDFIKNGTIKLIDFNITTLLLPEGQISAELEINTTSLYSPFNTSRYILTIIQNDTIPPNITHIYLPSYANLNQSLEVTLEVEEDIYITKVNVSCIYANYTFEFNKKITSSPYNLTFELPSTCISSLPNQTLGFYVYDLSSSHAYNFSVINTTTQLVIKKPLFSKYNRGDIVIFDLFYYNNATLSYADYNFSLGGDIYNGPVHGFYAYIIPTNFSDGNYTYELNISYGKNFATLKDSIYISSHLQMEPISPSEGKSYNAGEDLGIIYIRVKNITGAYIHECVESNLSCLSKNGSTHILTLNKTYLTGYGYVFMAMSGSCYAPQQDGVTFYLDFDIKDCNNNSYDGSLLLKTFASLTSASSGGGGGGGSAPSGGGSFSIPSYPSSPSLPLIKHTPKLLVSFNPNALLIQQGENKTLTLTIENLADFSYPVDIEVKTSSNDVMVKPLNYSSYLNKKLNIDFTIYTTLLTYPETKSLIFTVYANHTYYGSYNYSIDVIANVFVRALITKQNIINEYKQLLSVYKQEGLETSEFEKTLRKIEETYTKALNALSNNSLAEVMSYDAELNALLDRVKDENGDLMFKMIIKTHLFDIIFISFLTALGLEILFIYVLPYFYYVIQIKRYTYAMERAKRNKYELNKQFFSRKIDEITFRRTIEKEQAKITDCMNQIYKYKKKLDAYRSLAFLKFKL